MYLTSLFEVLPQQVTIDAIREVETLPRKYKKECEEGEINIQVHVNFYLFDLPYLFFCKVLGKIILRVFSLTERILVSQHQSFSLSVSICHVHVMGNHNFTDFAF